MGLVDLIDRHAARWASTPFVIGANDCAFAIQKLYAETGALRRFSNIVGLYRTRGEVDAFLAEATQGGGLVALLCDLARQEGWKRVVPAEARDGDLAIGRAPAGQFWLGVRRGPVFLSKAQTGLACLPVARARVAWHVTHEVV